MELYTLLKSYSPQNAQHEYNIYENVEYKLRDTCYTVIYAHIIINVYISHIYITECVL